MGESDCSESGRMCDSNGHVCGNAEGDYSGTGKKYVHRRENGEKDCFRIKEKGRKGTVYQFFSE